MLAQLQLRGELRYVGKRFSDNANRFRVPAYAVVDGGVSYALTDNLALDLRVYNLFDEIYATGGGTNSWILGMPRTAQLAVNVKF